VGNWHCTRAAPLVEAELVASCLQPRDPVKVSFSHLDALAGGAQTKARLAVLLGGSCSEACSAGSPAGGSGRGRGGWLPLCMVSGLQSRNSGVRHYAATSLLARGSPQKRVAAAAGDVYIPPDVLAHLRSAPSAFDALLLTANQQHGCKGRDSSPAKHGQCNPSRGGNFYLAAVYMSQRGALRDLGMDWKWNSARGGAIFAPILLQLPRR